MSGSLAAIFSFEKSRKWIIREGLNGISSSGVGRADRKGLSEVAGVSHGSILLFGSERKLARLSAVPTASTAAWRHRTEPRAQWHPQSYTDVGAKPEDE